MRDKITFPFFSRKIWLTLASEYTLRLFKSLSRKKEILLRAKNKSSRIVTSPRFKIIFSTDFRIVVTDIPSKNYYFHFDKNSLNLLINLLPFDSAMIFIRLDKLLTTVRKHTKILNIYIYILHEYHTLSRLFFSFHAACYSVIAVVFGYAKSRKSLPTKRSRGSIFVFESRSPSIEPQKTTLWCNGRAERVHKVARVFKRAPVEPL